MLGYIVHDFEAKKEGIRAIGHREISACGGVAGGGDYIAGGAVTEMLSLMTMPITTAKAYSR